MGQAAVHWGSWHRDFDSLSSGLRMMHIAVGLIVASALLAHGAMFDAAASQMLADDPSPPVWGDSYKAGQRSQADDKQHLPIFDQIRALCFFFMR